MELSSSNFFILFLLFADGIILCFGNAGENVDDTSFYTVGSNNTDEEPAEMPIFLIQTKGDPNEYSFANIQARLQKEIGTNAQVIMEKPYMIHLFGQLSRKGDLNKLAVLRNDVKFCKIHFHDLDNFLAALEHADIPLDEFFAVMSPCVRLKLDGKSNLVNKDFFSNEYVHQTPNMIITNIGMHTTMPMTEEMMRELATPMHIWLSYVGKNPFGMTKRMEIKGGNIEFVIAYLKALIWLFQESKLDGTNNFVLTLNGFALDKMGFGPFMFEDIFGLRKIAENIWVMFHRGQGNEKYAEIGLDEKVDAIFEIDKFHF